MGVSVRGGISGRAMRTKGSSKAFAFTDSGSITYTPNIATQAFWDYFVSGNYLYCASHTEGCVIYDITDPNAPVLETQIYSKDAAGDNVFDPCSDVDRDWETQ